MESHTIMAKAETTTRSPRGAKPVSQAFFTALDSLPEASRDAVAKAALVMLRDGLKLQREKTKAAAVKEKAAAAKTKAAAAKEKPVAKKAVAKPVAKKRVATAKPASVAEAPAAPAKRRGRKPAAAPVSA
jgi:hypothetical protein